MEDVTDMLLKHWFTKPNKHISVIFQRLLLFSSSYYYYNYIQSLVRYTRDCGLCLGKCYACFFLPRASLFVCGFLLCFWCIFSFVLSYQC